MQRVTSDPTADWSPSFSPDDSELVFYAFRSGTRHLWVMPAAGLGRLRREAHRRPGVVLGVLAGRRARLFRRLRR